MKPPKIRFSWFYDAPKNVSEDEYNWYSLRIFLSLVFGLVAVGMLVSAVLGLTNRTLDNLEAIPTVTIADISKDDVTAFEVVKLEGRLNSENPATMPDENGLQVIAGKLQVIARTRDSGNEKESHVLYSWSHEPEATWLTLGDNRILIGFDSTTILWTDTPHFDRPKQIREGASSRISRPVGYEYAGMKWPLPEKWGSVNNTQAELVRRYVPQNQPVVVVARLEKTNSGLRLVKPGNSDAKIFKGTLEQIRDSGRKTRSMFALLWIPLALASVFLARHSWRKRKEFIVRSSLP